MIDLIEMSEKEYKKFRDNEIKSYAQMKINTGKWSPSNSYRRAESELKHFLPIQPSAEGLVFLTIIVTDTGNCVGTICYGCPPNQSMYETYVYDIRIFDEYKRKGYGQMALLKLEEMLKNSGTKTVILDVSVNNKPAVLLYRKMGYDNTHYRMKKEL